MLEHYNFSKPRHSSANAVFSATLFSFVFKETITITPVSKLRTVYKYRFPVK